MGIRRLTMVSLLSAAGACFAAEPVVKPAPQSAVKPGARPTTSTAGEAPATKEAPIAVVISTIRKEALESLARSKQLPRFAADFAAEKRWTCADEQVIAALSRSLDRNAHMDAYIKWQLLGFEPDLTRLDAEAINRIGSSIPKPQRQPEAHIDLSAGASNINMSTMPKGTYIAGTETKVGPGVVAIKPKVRTAVSGSGLSTGGSMEGIDLNKVAAAANEQLTQQKQIVAQQNAAVHIYRDAITQRLPSEGGVRLAVMLRSMRDSIEAGEPDCREQMQRLIAAAATLSQEPTLTMDVRKTLVGWAWALGTMKTPVTQSVLVQNGQIVLQKTVVHVTAEDVKDLIAALQPPPQTPVLP